MLKIGAISNHRVVMDQRIAPRTGIGGGAFPTGAAYGAAPCWLCGGPGLGKYIGSPTGTLG
jgi:hypothetical protein